MPHSVLKVFSCFRPFVVFSFTFCHVKIMRLYALAAVLFATLIRAQQTTPASNRVKQHSGGDKKISTTLAPQQPSAADKSQPKSATTQGKDEDPSLSIPNLPPVSIKKDIWDKVYICFTFSLVVVGACTLGAIWYQAVQTRRAAEAAEESARAMHRQTGLLEKSIIIAEENAAAAKDNAQAANRSAEALINSERAWVTAVLIFSADLPDPPTNTRMTQASLVDGKTGEIRGEPALRCLFDL